MKICILSFDFFNFDQNIVLELKRRNVQVDHIDISQFKYKYSSVFDRITNFFNKLIFKKNIKKIEMEKHVLSHFIKKEQYDIILVIRPDCFTKQTHLEIKKHTNKYISYLYDSCTRFPIDYLLDGVFDQIFSFDLDDCQKFGFNFITNYIYIDKKEIQAHQTNQNVFIIISVDERLSFLNNLANHLSEQKIPFKFLLIGKRKPKNINSNIIYSKKHIFQGDLQNDLENSKVFLDLIRHGHNGLSFRIFEALAMQRKIITTNKSISQYDFYNPNNILILDENKPININPDFFATPYEPLSDEMYKKYTIENWVKTVFKLE
ncbi:hypothetical protein EV143_10799 [Flavobacterium chryseum]|uniref:hypothetical protein n=1 Tax=Flavobacterium sp. P3160 TaxID=2512113 RepID=UPI00105E3847|nr:hypothetical protein [Flavobacterium sp. P3160]TDO72794.1 hypothetical protein EV143_10799 [Flavobacterium sp. P3160]